MDRDHRIAVIEGNKVVLDKARKILRRRGLTFPVHDPVTTDEEIEQVARQSIAKGTKIFISCGVTLKTLRAKFDIHMVDIRHTLYEFRATMKKLGQDPSEVAFVGTAYYYGIAQQEGLTDQALSIRVFSQEDRIRTIHALKHQGKKIIIGGGRTVLEAERIGLQGGFLEVEDTSLEYAIDEALHNLKILEELEKHGLIINSILQGVSEGVVGIDENGRLFAMNSVALRLLGLEGTEWKGKHIDEILPIPNLAAAPGQRQELSGELAMVGSNHISVTSTPIQLNTGSNILGTVLTIQEVGRIQSLENKVRKSFLGNGHVARAMFGQMVGHSSAFLQVIETAKEYAQVDSSILLLGETGVGKEVMAQSIHNHSSRRRNPFIAVNCAALPPNLLESELFGYVKGAFTGADPKGKIGLFELAHTGTVFLDEIGEMPIHLQSKLLRVLQEKEISRLGADKVIPINVRIISATNKDLASEIRRGEFREDLYYRICVLSLNLPPLRERRDDIVEIAQMFIDGFNTEFGKNVRSLTPEAKKLITLYDWPGNIRQLKNFIERSVVLCKSDCIDEDLVKRLLDQPIREPAFLRQTKTGLLSTVEESLIRKLLLETNGDKHEVARILGISQTTLWRRLKKNRS